ncbi:MAG TPA: Gfo/Idh/MocA family oxidoreductase [Candidatus Binatia bacterium]|jgi:predicted dehydrogenase|nr:Gfo/Idh/MocA family oxidoreductase [Candidatus Binatia bacterium]
MHNPLSRRRFLKQSSILTASAAAVGSPLVLRAARSPNDTVRVGIIGCNGRGLAHIAGYLSVPDAEIVSICDVDSRALQKGIAAVAQKQRKPKGVKDLRQMLEDPDLDAVSIATPDHWHAPAAILACSAGKHVYVEKPGSHNLRESELLVEAARKHKRTVQMGNQRRSWPWVIEAIQALHAGELGEVYFARGWYTNHRGTIGHGKAVPVPEWLDWSLWQGPAPEQAFRDNIVHYNWHWFWRWGTGELGNNGVHALDLARWGLRVDLPRRVTCGGNRYHYQDDWETPDTCVASFDFGAKGIAWEGQSCDPRGFESASFGVDFFAEKGSMAIAGDDCKLYDLNQKLVRQIKGRFDDVLHFANFIEGIREGKPLRAQIEDGQKSTLLCHLGNIAWRTGHTIKFEPATRKILDDKAAMAMCGREYRHGWEPRV